MRDVLELAGKVVVVTGGGKGVGRGITSRFLEAGAEVVVCGRNEPAGLIRTEQAHLHYGDESGIAAVAATVPLGRMGDPGDVGDVCLFLASPLARYVSGASILLHGGGERQAFLAAAKRGE